MRKQRPDGYPPVCPPPGAGNPFDWIFEETRRAREAARHGAIDRSEVSSDQPGDDRRSEGVSSDPPADPQELPAASNPVSGT